MATSIRQDFIRLRSLDRAKKAAAEKAKLATNDFKKFQMKVLDRAEAEDTHVMGTSGTLFSVVHKVKGNVTDKKAFVRWALEQDEGIQEFLQQLVRAVTDAEYPDDLASELVDSFYEAVMGTALVHYSADGTELNRIATAHTDNDEPLPPGVGWYPDNYVSQRAA